MARKRLVLNSKKKCHYFFPAEILFFSRSLNFLCALRLLDFKTLLFLPIPITNLSLIKLRKSLSPQMGNGFVSYVIYYFQAREIFYFGVDETIFSYEELCLAVADADVYEVELQWNNI